MKKALVIVLALVMALSVVGLVSCSGKTYDGEYKYENPYAKGSYYGAKVKVTVQGNVITNVTLLPDSESGWTNLSPNWTNTSDYSIGEAAHDTEGKTNWRKYGQAMVDSFVGLTVEEVLGIKVYVHVNGEPYTTQNNSIETIKYVPEQLAVVVGGHTVGEDVELAQNAGATQSSSRVILAVQDALLKAQGKTENANRVILNMETVTGEYKYENAWTPGEYYGVSVTVVVQNDKIKSIDVGKDTETMYNLSDGWGSKANWSSKEKTMIDSFVGLSVADVKAITVKVTATGQPDTGTSSAPVNPFEHLPEGLVVIQGGVGNIAADAGATQSSGRLILAVQNALSKLPQ